MRKMAEKVALVAMICISLVFVLATLLYMTNTISYYDNIVENPNGTLTVMPPNQENGILSILMIVLGVLFVALAFYLLYVNFSERENMKRILLFSDCDSATRTNTKVINNIVRGCAKQVDGISVRNVKVRTDEKGGLVATLAVTANAANVSGAVNQLRCLVADSFSSTLGLTFNTINFDVKKLNGKYRPNVQRAQELAQTLQENQAETLQNYQDPLGTQCEATENEESERRANEAENDKDERAQQTAGEE